MRLLLIICLFSVCVPLLPSHAIQEATGIEATYLGSGLALADWDAVFADELLQNDEGEIPLYAQLWEYDADGVLDRGEGLLDQWVCAGALQAVSNQNDACTPYNLLTAQPVTIQWKDGQPTDHEEATLLYANAALDVALIQLAETPEQAGDPLTDLAVISALYAANEQIGLQAINEVLANAVVPEATTGAETIGDPFAPELGNGGIDVQHYALDLAVTFEPITFAGTAILSIKVVQPNLSVFTLDFRQMNTTAVAVNGDPVKFEQLSRKLRITLPEPYAYGAEFELTVHYDGVLKPAPSRYIFFEIGAMIDPDVPRFGIASEPDASNSWFPANDHPLDPATFAFDITVPAGYTVAANGQPTGTSDNADGTVSYQWEMPDLMATYLATMAVAEYNVIEETAPNGIPVRHFVYSESDLAGMRALFSGTGQAITTLEDWFGPYPYDSYGHVITPMLGGALETQTMTTMPNIPPEAGEAGIWFLVIHELAHQWFGNSIRLGTWQDIWLNEGWATYAEWIGDDARYGMGTSAQLRASVEEALRESERTTPLGAPEPGELFSQESYGKGGWVLHMLAVELGYDLWRDTIKAYASAFAGDTVTTNEFFQFVEQHTGRDLTQFRQQWVEQPGLPDYTLYWQTGGQPLNIRVCSNRPEQDYTIMLPLNISGEGANSLLHTLYLTPEQHEFSFDPGFVVTGIQFDPLQAVLDNITVQEVDELPACE